MHLIAVIMGAPTRDVRNEAAKTLLDWGFANYFVYSDGGADAGNVRVTGGVRRNVRVQIRRIQRTSRIVEARQDYG